MSLRGFCLRQKGVIPLGVEEYAKGRIKGLTEAERGPVFSSASSSSSALKTYSDPLKPTVKGSSTKNLEEV
jgi:hypothetical protein